MLEDISATGVRVRRPDGWRGKVGDHVSMDMLVGDSLNIHVQAVVARISSDSVGFRPPSIRDSAGLRRFPCGILLGG